MPSTVIHWEDALLERWVSTLPHASAATIQGPTIPTGADVGRGMRSLRDRLMRLSGWSWVAAGSVVGFEGLEVIVVSMLHMPEVIPLIVLVLALVAVVRDRWRARRVPGLVRRRWVRE